MKNLIVRKDHDNALDFFGDSFDSFLRPLFFDEKFDKMKTDIKENENEYEMEIELPGYNKENISIDYEEGNLTVSAEKSEQEAKNYIRKERSVSCQRSFYVGDVDEAEIKAKYENGILTVTVPKEERKKPEKKGISIA